MSLCFNKDDMCDDERCYCTSTSSDDLDVFWGEDYDK